MGGNGCEVTPRWQRRDSSLLIFPRTEVSTAVPRPGSDQHRIVNAHAQVCTIRDMYSFNPKFRKVGHYVNQNLHPYVHCLAGAGDLT
jgi:hypothetical protein